MKSVLLGVLMFTFLQESSKEADLPLTAYDFSFQSIANETSLPLKAFQGKVILIVNTASQCGFTRQYSGLENLYLTYKDKGLVVLGVPSNDFGAQEPGKNEEILSFCQVNYGVTFPLTAKEHVSGDHAHPFYKWAKKTLGFGTAPKWNFHKYLVDRQGRLIDYFYSTTGPENARLKLSVEAALSEDTRTAPIAAHKTDE